MEADTTGDITERRRIMVSIGVIDTVEWRLVRVSRSRTTVATAVQSVRTRCSHVRQDTSLRTHHADTDTCRRSIISLRDNLAAEDNTSLRVEVEPSSGSAAPAHSTTDSPRTFVRCAASHVTSDRNRKRDTWSRPLRPGRCHYPRQTELLAASAL